MLVLSPAADFDGDGFPTWQEELLGTDASDPASAFRIANAAPDTDDTAVLTWTSVSGRYYVVYGGTALTAATGWSPLSLVSNLLGTGGMMSYTDHVGTAASRFYRLGVQLP